MLLVVVSYFGPVSLPVGRRRALDLSLPRSPEPLCHCFILARACVTPRAAHRLTSGEQSAAKRFFGRGRLNPQCESSIDRSHKRCNLTVPRTYRNHVPYIPPVTPLNTRNTTPRDACFSCGKKCACAQKLHCCQIKYSGRLSVDTTHTPLSAPLCGKPPLVSRR